MAGSTNNGTTSSSVARLIVDGATELGISRAKYAHLLGIAPEHLHDDLYRTPSATAIHIWELMVVKAPWTEVSPLLVGRSQLGSLGLWDYLLTSGPTLLDGVRDSSTYLAAIADNGTEAIEIVEDGEHITISHVNLADLTYDAASAIRSFALGLYHRRLSEAARRPLVPVRVALAAKAPRRHGSLAEMYGTRAIDFEVPVSSITFLASDLRAATPYAPPGLSAVLRRHAEQTLATAIPLHNWLDAFQVALRAAHGEDNVTLSSVAQRLAISTRTLQRRLDEHGTTWSEQVETVRREQITQLLRTTDLSMESIAARTGYGNARALRRAVQRWYGDTPAALRQALSAPV
ncbi:helix-turn-helix domain-containing protein [Streptomyces sp. NPDC052396]|uniref:helix-turn-helix domain-containing protein n=1 Tax=Streptomyces sp. NPDC052396 TaxID=3365689 RepID=UPI0037D276A6